MTPTTAREPHLSVTSLQWAVTAQRTHPVERPPTSTVGAVEPALAATS